MKLFGRKSAGRDDSRPVLSRVGASRVMADWPVSYEAQVREAYLGNAIAQRAVRVVADGLGEAPLTVSSPELEVLVRARSGGQALLATVAAHLLLHGNAWRHALGAGGRDDGRGDIGRAGERAGAGVG
ncbi:hypothetical protein [Sphingomonas sp. PB4P5]|uniref:hypothetical protein n=1 Tax=Parasphingomonas puruogangriensis TaxID=3096155 RepID=UPI002FC5AE7D